MAYRGMYCAALGRRRSRQQRTTQLSVKGFCCVNYAKNGCGASPVPLFLMTATHCAISSWDRFSPNSPRSTSQYSLSSLIMLLWLPLIVASGALSVTNEAVRSVTKDAESNDQHQSPAPVAQRRPALTQDGFAPDHWF